MVANKRVTGRALPLPAGLGVGLGVSTVVTVLLAALLTQLIATEVVGEQWIGWGAMVMLPIASAAGAVVAALSVKRRWFLTALTSGGMYFIFLLAVNSFFFGGQFSGIGVTAILILLGALAVGLWGLKGEGRSRKKKFKYRSR